MTCKLRSAWKPATYWWCTFFKYKRVLDFLKIEHEVNTVLCRESCSADIQHFPDVYLIIMRRKRDRRRYDRQIQQLGEAIHLKH